MNDNWVTSPAHMAVPGNIYHTAMSSDDQRECQPKTTENLDDGLLFCLIFGLVLVLAFCIGFPPKENR